MVSVSLSSASLRTLCVELARAVVAAVDSACGIRIPVRGNLMFCRRRSMRTRLI